MRDEPSIKYARYSPVTESPPAQAAPGCGCAGLFGLLHYRQWWERSEVDISICGKLVSGTPIFVEENTLRVVNSKYSYFIPLEKIDYIRTADGLCPGLQIAE
ncbi:MAG: hypothetical protein FWF60_00060 [Oscillospiraceae bacterium]|nr:hypothetical protein [Oscillospiraceae bacterium]